MLFLFSLYKQIILKEASLTRQVKKEGLGPTSPPSPGRPAVGPSLSCESAEERKAAESQRRPGEKQRTGLPQVAQSYLHR